MKFLYFIFLSLFLIPVNVFGTNSLDVVINEMAWMGTKVEGVESKNWWRYEWLELYNNTQNPILLDGWKIELYRTELDWTLELKGTILPESHFLIVSSDKIFPNHDLNYSNLGGKLNNNGQKILLKDSSGNILDIIDCFSYQKWFAGDNTTKQTMERKNPKIGGGESGNWQNSQNAGGTPKALNFIAQQPTPTASPNPTLSPAPTPSPTPIPTADITPPETETSDDAIAPENIFINSLKISEFIPNPKGNDEENEWFELYNKANEKVDISDWKLKSGEKTFTIPKQTFILPNEFLVFGAKTTKLTLKNSDSALELYFPNGAIAQKIDYQETKEGWSIARIGEEYLWTNNPTPGLPNKKSSDPQELQPTPPKKQNLNYQSAWEPTPLETEPSPTPEELPAPLDSKHFTPLEKDSLTGRAGQEENPENKSGGNILNSPWLGFILIIIFGFLAGWGLVKIRKER